MEVILILFCVYLIMNAFDRIINSITKLILSIKNNRQEPEKL